MGDFLATSCAWCYMDSLYNVIEAIKEAAEMAILEFNDNLL